MNLHAGLPVKYKAREPLKKHTTFGIGGPCQYWAEPRNYPDLARLIAWSKKNNKRVFVIGAGSNLLVSDAGVRGVVIRLSSAAFRGISMRNNYVCAGAGSALSKLSAFCAAAGLSGLEFLTGIPGTVGGAIAGNAGTKDKSIGDLVEFVKVMDYNGKIKTIKRKAAHFGYRSSGLYGFIVLQAGFMLVKKDRRTIRTNITGYARARKASQGAGWRSAGCCFKNPPGDSAGRLIDACGFKGAACGNASVSQIHANFILNDGNARCRDVVALMQRIASKVKKKYGIVLEPEIKIWR
ncbi:MAG: UDP-N-acetylmuramate dehydrogenase [Candidatus Omnitrophica bacterium]|jgi:UDP-N-acetylmuramate dehydrogenase|nr:UDP-N-acetylmuramate dehydrogenase [Candidatus Omnitrophota bacterium]